MEINDIHIRAKNLTKDAQKLANRLFRLTSNVATNRESLATLGADAGTLAYQFAGLRVDIIRLHEEDQRNGVNPNS